MIPFFIFILLISTLKSLSLLFLYNLLKVAFMDRDVGKADEEFRTSSTYFLPSQTPMLQHIDERVSVLTRIPKQHQEYVQVLRYELGEYYGSHHDSWDADYYQVSWFFRQLRIKFK